MPVPTSGMSSSNNTSTGPRVFTISSFSVGSVVELHSLQNATHLNGKTATVTRLLPGGRFAVLFPDGKQLSLKGETLQISSGHVEEKSCLACYQIFPGEKLKSCSRCRLAQYCSKECQAKHWQAHRNDCELLRSARKAKDDEDKLPTDKRDRIYVRQERGGCYLEQGNLSAAEKEFRALIEIENAHWVQNYLNLSGALVRQGKLSEALEMVRRAIECEDEEINTEKIAKARAYSQMADLLLREDPNNMQEAMDAVNKGLKLDPLDGYMWRQLSRLLGMKGDDAGARNAMQRANQLGGPGQTSSFVGGVEHSEILRF